MNQMSMQYEYWLNPFDISISGATLSTFIPFPLLFQCECALMIVNVNVIPCFHRHDFPFQPFFQITVSLNVSLNVSIMFRLVVQSGSTFRSTSFNSHVSADTDHSKKKPPVQEAQKPCFCWPLRPQVCFTNERHW